MDQLPELDYQSFLAEAMRDHLDYLDHLGFAVVWRAYALRHLDRFLVDHRVENFDQHDPRWILSQLMDQYRGRVKAQTLRRWRQAFQGLCRYLVRGGWMRDNPRAPSPLLDLNPIALMFFPLRNSLSFLITSSSRPVKPATRWPFTGPSVATLSIISSTPAGYESLKPCVWLRRITRPRSIRSLSGPRSSTRIA